jgi:radical SAM protein with 4Fe4S-binding SPASM domain
LFVAPYEANLLITGRCNLSCRHCGIFSQGPLESDLGVPDWSRILTTLAEAKLFRLTLTGGEPLVREDFPWILAEVLRRPFRFSLNTNAVLVTRETAALLKAASPRLQVVMISLDGDSPATHDAIRGDGAFRGTMEGISILRSAGVPLGFFFTVNRLNAHRARETAELALSLGRWIKFNCFLDAGPGTDSGLNPGAEQVRSAAASVLELAARFPGRISGAFLDLAGLGAEASGGSGIPFGPESGPSCGGGRSKIAVMPDGWVTPCDHLPLVRLGSLLCGSLEEILTGPAMTAFAASYETRRHTLTRCGSCPLMPLCPGSCPAAPCSELSCLRNYSAAPE